MKIKVFQVNSDLDSHGTKFRDYDSVLKTAGRIDPSVYNSKALNFSDEFKIINEKFNDYKTKIGEHISNLGYLSETEAEFRKIAESIDFQCESIILKFYK